MGPKAAATNEVIFALADRGPLFGQVYPAISSDGGQSWHVDGPRFWYAAAQAPNVTSTIGALAPNWAYAWGQGGNFVKVTHDGGAHWWVTDFTDGVRRVEAKGRTLRAWEHGSDVSEPFIVYVSSDYGLSWVLRHP